MIKIAQAYLDAGLFPFPLATNSKEPLKGSRGFHDAARTSDEVSRLFASHKGNIGLTFGPDTFVIDLDVKKGKDGIAAFDELADKHGGIPDTLTASTPSGGKHLVFRKPAEIFIPNKTDILAPGIDTRTDAGYIVAEPSIVGGKAYQWLDWVPGENPGENDPEIADATEWLLNLLQGEIKPANGGLPAAPFDNVSPETLRELRSALTALRADDYNEWINNGLALKTAGEAARSLWLEWSQTSDKWLPEDAKQWDGLKPNTTDYRVIFKKAQAAGWVNPLSKPKNMAVSTPTPATLSAADLMNMQFREIKWCVQDILPEGTYLLSAKPKVGKSWLALQIALAIVKGTQSLGKQCESGSALVLALEDNQRRLQSRLARLGAFIFPDMERLKKLEVATEWPRVNEGGSEKIEQWIVANPDARLVVIDTLAKFRPTTAGRASAYEQDYEAMAPLKALSDKYNVTILIVTHNRKMSSDDPLDTISGTMGLSGGCDGALIIDRQRGNNDATLHLIGRDIENDGAFSIRFQKDSCTWEMLGGSEEITASKSRDFLLRLFKDEGRPLTPKEVAELTGRPSSTVRRLLSEMVKSGNLEKSDIGVYHLPGDPPIKGEHPEQGEQCEQGEHYVHTLTVTPKPIRRAVEEEIEAL